MNTKFVNNLKRWMRKMNRDFPEIYYLYSYDENLNIHYINVFPPEKADDNEKYCNAELDFIEDVCENCPTQTLLFSTGNELFMPLFNAEKFAFHYRGHDESITIDLEEYTELPTQNYTHSYSIMNAFIF